jgi:hypothetical protein
LASIILAGHEVDDKKPLRLVCYLTDEHAKQVKRLQHGTAVTPGAAIRGPKRRGSR